MATIIFQNARNHDLGFDSWIWKIVYKATILSIGYALQGTHNITGEKVKYNKDSLTSANFFNDLSHFISL